MYSGASITQLVKILLVKQLLPRRVATHEVSTLSDAPCSGILQVIQVHRSSLCKDMSRQLEDESVTNNPTAFEIIDDQGKRKQKCWKW